MAGSEVLTVLFQQRADFLAQEAHLSKGALFLPCPEPPPQPFAELLLRIESPTGDVLERPARALQITAHGVAFAFVDAREAEGALRPLFDAARAAASGEDAGATWVFWGRPAPVAEEEPPPEEAPAAPGDAALYDRIKAMGTQEKIRLALHGGREERLILLKDVNKTLQTFLLQNPRITLDEIRYLAGFRQASPDALATIAAHREWGQNPGVIAALVRNPKTPSTIAAKLLDKIPIADVRRIAKSNEAPRAVTIAARKRLNEP